MKADNLSRAAIYVKMSTDNREYPTDDQRSKIREYALLHGLDIVRECVDEGRSGLDIKRRAALIQLIRDIVFQHADFGSVIVYDVSRWGRFQEIEEAAYHEHTRRRAGIYALYCAGHFVGDNGPYAALMKSMMRLAGSRDG